MSCAVPILRTLSLFFCLNFGRERLPPPVPRPSQKGLYRLAVAVVKDPVLIGEENGCLTVLILKTLSLFFCLNFGRERLPPPVPRPSQKDLYRLAVAIVKDMVKCKFIRRSPQDLLQLLESTLQPLMRCSELLQIQ